MKLDMVQYADLYYDAAVETARRKPGCYAARQLLLLSYAASRRAKPQHFPRLLDIAHHFGGRIHLLETALMFSGDFIERTLESLNKGLSELPEDICFVAARNDIVERVVNATIEGKFLEAAAITRRV